MSYLVPATEMRGNGVGPARAGWDYTGMKLLALAAGDDQRVDLIEEEAVLVPMAGNFAVEAGDRRFELEGRPDCFSGRPDVLYLPAGATFSVASPEGGEVVMCTARAQGGGEPIHRRAGEIEIEVRGAGAATRQIHQLLPAQVAGPEKLIVVEVITPGGNWSSYPPHKHDEYGPAECPLEEIYYFRFQAPQAFGLHCTYTKDGSIDETVTVRDGDAFVIPRGYHGPCGALPGYPMYYLNAMAGPGPRAWLISTDPDHEWLCEEWADQEPDPRVSRPSWQGKEKQP